MYVYIYIYIYIHGIHMICLTKFLSGFIPSGGREVIERGSAVHCVSAYEGDIIVRQPGLGDLMELELGVYSDLMGFYSDLMGFYSDLMGFYSDLMGFYSDLMEFYNDLMGFYSDLIGYEWDVPSGND